MQLAQRLSSAPCRLARPSVGRAPRVLSLPGARTVPQQLVARATGGDQSDVEDCKGIVADYCSIDPATGRRMQKRTLGEMEQDFLEAMASWYYEGKPKMSDEEFNVLKEELIWSGSKVVVLDSQEKRFLEASMAYARGKPILSDTEFDALKAELRNKSSIVTAQGPRCSIRSKKMYADAAPDYTRMVALNLPSALLVLGAFAGVDYASGFALTSLVELPAPYGVWILWSLVLPTLFVISYVLTQIGFKDSVILKGPCPSCGTETFTYFGDVFTVAGNRGQNVVECSNCKADLTFDEYKRVIVVSELSEVKQQKIAEAEKKKAAAAAKKKMAVAAKSE